MSRRNVELIRGVYEEMARGNMWALAPLLDPDVEWDFSGVPGGGVYHGPNGVAQATKDWLKAFDWYRKEGEEFIDAGEHVVVLGTDRARIRGTDRDIDTPLAEVWTMRDGKVVRFAGYEDRAQALQAVGLSE